MQDKIHILPSWEPVEPGRASIHNLPAQLTPLIGREQEVASACALLLRPDVRLLTLTGTGGVGKTRLALQVATVLLDDFADGVSFVSLAPISDPGLVIPTIAQTFDLKETAAQPLLDLLKAFLQDKRLLLVLDNFEQVLPAAPQLTDLLAFCPDLKLLVTSRAVLHLYGEQEFAVPPLALPDLTQLPVWEALSQYAAVALFLQRAQAARPQFQLTGANARATAEICVRLDGLPLAIELAAARVKLFSPQALLKRLEHRFQVLTGGAQDRPVRQQTLRNTIDWSYHLLTSQEQRLFRRLAVFVGGCTLEAIEALCTALDGGAEEVLDGVTSLLDKSLLQQIEQEDEEPRLMLLETLREYGLEALATSGEREITQKAHAAYYLQLAEEAEPAFWGPQQAVWFDRLEREHDNLRAALNWLLVRAEAQENIKMALRLGGALWWFWSRREHFREGSTFLERALAQSEAGATMVRAKALRAAGQLAAAHGHTDRGESLCQESLLLLRELGNQVELGRTFFPFGVIAYWRGDLAAARSRHEEGLAIAREAGDKRGMASLLHGLASVTSLQGEYTRAHTMFEESFALLSEVGDKGGMASSRQRLAEMLFAQGHLMRAQLLAEEALARHREMGDKGRIGETLSLLGQIAYQQGDAATARLLAEESLATGKEARDHTGLAWALFLLAKVQAHQGNYPAARACCEQSLETARRVGDQRLIAASLKELSDIVAAQGELAWAARLWGAAEALREAKGTPLPPVYRADYEQAVAAARSHLGEKALATAWAQGRTMSPEQALAAREPATTSTPIPAERPSPPLTTARVTYPDGLTAREVEVIGLVAQGLSDAQVAEQLVISPRTVHAHLSSIYSKLSITSRSAATRYAIEHHLI
jgi:predicted ATPase/DNA-binding CsgD family transcriptional regulator